MTTHTSNASAPWHMWVLGGLLLLWNGMAAFDYIMTLIRFEPYLAAYPEETLAYFFNAPIWMYGVWGVSMLGGLIGTILLLARRRTAVPVYALAWLSSVLAVIYSFVKPVPGGGNALFGVVVIMISLLVLFYFYRLKNRGVLR